MMINSEREELFDEWWEIYGKKVGKKAAKKAWAKVKIGAMPLIFAHTPEYVRSTPEKQYRMHPATYLNGEHWEDEIIFKNKQPNAMEQNTVEKLHKYG